MRIEELLTDPRRREFAASPEADALVENGALQEAALIDVRVDMITGSAWLLFDCRGALQIEMGNTAIVVVHLIEALHWAGGSRGVRTWRAVTEWLAAAHGGRLSLVVGMTPGGRLEVSGRAGEFYVGNVPGCDDPPPNLQSASDVELRAGLAHWGSEFELVHASFLDPEGG